VHVAEALHVTLSFGCDRPGHTVHAPPELPHALGVAPAPHVPLSQQPPLHAWLAEHVVVHACVLPSHAWSLGQSVAALHPHAPVARHAEPDEFEAQLTHMPPVAPHAVCAVPAAHVPLSQQPPLHV
jgi:hypothetical protein